jgi:hypothetical protein
MQALKITEIYREPLTQANIVICTYMTTQGEVDCIDLSYQAQYPDFEVVTLVDTETDLDDLIASYLEGDL